MPLLLTLDIHENANLPQNSQLRVSWSNGEGVTFSLAGPTVRQSGTLLPPFAKAKLRIAATIGAAKPIELEADGIPADNAALNFNVFPRLPNNKFHIAGSIAHSKTEANVCRVTCLADGNTADPGECIDCEDDVAIVELCCC